MPLTGTTPASMLESGNDGSEQYSSSGEEGAPFDESPGIQESVNDNIIQEDNKIMPPVYNE
jgi:hypothetical protein